MSNELNYKFGLFKSIIIGKLSYLIINDEKGAFCDYDEFTEYESKIAKGKESFESLLNLYSENKNICGKNKYTDPYLAYIGIKWINTHWTYATFLDSISLIDIVQDILSYPVIIDKAFEDFILFCGREFFNSFDTNYNFDELFIQIKELLIKFQNDDIDCKNKELIKKFYDINKGFLKYVDDIEDITKYYFIKLFESKEYMFIIRNYTDVIIKKLETEYQISKYELDLANKYCKYMNELAINNIKNISEEKIISSLKITKSELIQIKRTLSHLNKNNTLNVSEFNKNKGISYENNNEYLEQQREEAIKELSNVEKAELEKQIDYLNDSLLERVKNRFSHDEFFKLFNKEKDDCSFDEMRNHLKNKIRRGEDIWL